MFTIPTVAPLAYIRPEAPVSRPLLNADKD